MKLKWLSGASVAALTATVALSAPPATSGAVAVKPWVTTSGVRFVNRGGSPVILRGVNVGAGPNASLQSRVQALGGNFARIHVCWSDLEPSAPSGGAHAWNQSLLGRIDTQVDWYRAHHINVLLDLHQFNWSPYFSSRGCGIPAWFYSKVKEGRYAPTSSGLIQAFHDFYTDRDALALYRDVAAMVAARYRSNPAVVGYEVLNEPYGRNTHKGTQQVIAFEAKVRKTIMAADPNRTVFVMTRYGGDKGLLDASFAAFGSLKHLALDYHDYYSGVRGTGMTFDGENWSPSWDATHVHTTTDYHGSKALQRAMLDFPEHKSWDLGIPVLIGEWGARRDDRNGSGYQSQMLSIMGASGLSWARWSLSTNDMFGLLTTQGQPTSDFDQLQAALRATPNAPRIGPKAPAFALSRKVLHQGHAIRICFRPAQRARQVALGVRTASGKRVRTRYLGPVRATTACSTYKGNAKNGRPLPRGTYMLRVSAAYASGGARFSVWRPLEIRR